MIEKIILAITHSDDYTDYLYQTACLTNSRIIPMLNPTASELYDATGDNTIVYRCDGRYKDFSSCYSYGLWKLIPVFFDITELFLGFFFFNILLAFPF